MTSPYQHYRLLFTSDGDVQQTTINSATCENYRLLCNALLCKLFKSCTIHTDEQSSAVFNCGGVIISLQLRFYISYTGLVKLQASSARLISYKFISLKIKYISLLI